MKAKVLWKFERMKLRFYTRFRGYTAQGVSVKTSLLHARCLKLPYVDKLRRHQGSQASRAKICWVSDSLLWTDNVRQTLPTIVEASWRSARHLLVKFNTLYGDTSLITPRLSRLEDVLRLENYVYIHTSGTPAQNPIKTDTVSTPMYLEVLPKRQGILRASYQTLCAAFRRFRARDNLECSS